jgi:membrane-bound metal-dependent hydrolase YbcI (DUF457 family)
MVMGVTHAMHGAAAGLAVSNLAPALGQPMNIPTALTLGGLCAGAAIAPDLDHPNATASKSLGVVSALGSAAIQTLSANVYAHTRTKKDRNNADGHRGITHTPFGPPGLALLFGGIPAIAGIWGPLPGTVATLVVIWLFLVWALRALPPKHSARRDYVMASFLTGLAYLALSSTYAGVMPLFIGAAVGFGAWIHALGDSLTDYGAPLLFPFVIKGERWRAVGPPEPLRFKAGKKVEKKFVRPLSAVGVGIALAGIVPGFLPFLIDRLTLLCVLLYERVSLAWQ